MEDTFEVGIFDAQNDRYVYVQLVGTDDLSGYIRHAPAYGYQITSVRNLSF